MRRVALPSMVYVRLILLTNHIIVRVQVVPSHLVRMQVRGSFLLLLPPPSSSSLSSYRYHLDYARGVFNMYRHQFQIPVGSYSGCCRLHEGHQTCFARIYGNLVGGVIRGTQNERGPGVIILSSIGLFIALSSRRFLPLI